MFRKRSLLLFAALLISGFSSHLHAQIGGPNGTGQWGPVIQLPIVPASAANLPNGKIVAWSAYDRFRFGGNRGKTYTVVFDPATNQSEELLISNTGHDMFCPGTSSLVDGRVIVTGGSSSGKTSIYDPVTESWSSSGNMNIPRGYHGMVTLGDGKAFVIGGSWSGGSGNKHGEVWQNDTWSRLNGVPVGAITDGTPGGNKDYHVWLWPAPNGKLFHAGPSPKMHWITTTGNGSYTNAGNRGDDTYAVNGITVMYDTGKLLKAGGSTSYGGSTLATGNTYTIDINQDNVQVKKVQSLTLPRSKHNSVVLPTGEVLIIGGLKASQNFSDLDSRFIPELWNPQTEQWRSLAPMTVPRNYHSVALLLPDGRVFAGGGGLCGNCTANHPDAEIFSPSYLFNANGTPATRPQILNAPQVANPSSIMYATTNGAISKWAMVRYNSVTHSTNNEQRRFEVSAQDLGNNQYEISIPNTNIAIPGYYMLFAINANGVPSVARVIQIDPQAVIPGLPRVTDVSTTPATCTNGGSVTFTFLDDPGRSAIEFSLDGGTTYQPQVPDNSGTVTYNDLAPGSYNFYVRWGDNSFPTNLGIHTIASQAIPQVTSITSQPINCATGKGSMTFFFEDQDGRTHLEFSFDGGTTYRNQVPDDQGSVTYTDLDGGSYEVFVRWGNNECPTSLGAQVVPLEPVAINFQDYTIKTYVGTGQDKGTSEVLNGGSTLKIKDNAWKYIDYSYTLTANSVLAFEFKSTIEGEIHMIGLDNDNGWREDMAFKLHGTQNVGSDIEDFDNYSGTDYKQYIIPIGQYYTGEMDRIFFLADHDLSPSNGNSFYRNVKVYESGACENSRISLRMALEGSFDPATGLMSDALLTGGLLSSQDPYGLNLNADQSLFTQTGDNAPCDWVKVELRDANNPSQIIAESACLIQRDGDLMDINGNTEINFPGLIPGTYYIVIGHYNHLFIATAQPLNPYVVDFIDFTSPGTQVFSDGAEAMKDENGTMLLWAGDANGDGSVNADDKNTYWRQENGGAYQYGQTRSDFNLDGTVNARDKNSFWRRNNSRVQQLP